MSDLLDYQPSFSDNTVGGNFSLSGFAPSLPGNTAPSTQPKTGGGGLGFMGNTTTALQGLSSLMSMYQAYEQNKLMKRQYKASVADRNQNIANMAETTNLGLRNQASAAAQMSGHNYGSDGYKQYLDNNTVKVDGSPIKA